MTEKEIKEGAGTKKKLAIGATVIIILFLFLIIVTSQQHQHSTYIPQHYYPPRDSDMDGYPDDRDAFPYDFNEQIDSDHDGIGDNADIYDYGNGGIKVDITYYNGDGYLDEGLTNPDPYFKIWVYTANGGLKKESVGFKKSNVFANQDIIENPLSLTVDVPDNIQYVIVEIEVWDDDVLSSDVQIDINGDYVQFKNIQKTCTIHPPNSQLTFKRQTYTNDGSKDGKDEMDGYIEYYIDVVRLA